MAAPAAPAAAVKSSSGLKILLFVLGFCVLFGVAAVGAVFYIGHRVKQAVVEKAESYGVDLGSIAPSTSAPSSGRNSAAKKMPCDFLSKEEAASLLGEPIERATVSEQSCVYYGPPGLAAKLAQANTSDMMKQAQAGKEMNGGDVADTVTKMMGAMAAQSGANGGDVPLLQVAVDPDGKPQMIAIEANKALFGQIPGASSEIPNLGDRAIRLGNLGLNVIKGDTFLRVLVGPVPGANDKAVAVARTIVPRM